MTDYGASRVGHQHRPGVRINQYGARSARVSARPADADAVERPAHSASCADRCGTTPRSALSPVFFPGQMRNVTVYRKSRLLGLEHAQRARGASRASSCSRMVNNIFDVNQHPDLHRPRSKSRAAPFWRTRTAPAAIPCRVVKSSLASRSGFDAARSASWRILALAVALQPAGRRAGHGARRLRPQRHRARAAAAHRARSSPPTSRWWPRWALPTASSASRPLRAIRREVLDRPLVGGRLGFSVDEVVAQRPDLVVVTPSRQAANQLIDPMERLGIPIVVLLQRNVAEILSNIRLLGTPRRRRRARRGARGQAAGPPRQGRAACRRPKQPSVDHDHRPAGQRPAAGDAARHLHRRRHRARRRPPRLRRRHHRPGLARGDLQRRSRHAAVRRQREGHEGTDRPSGLDATCAR